MNVPLTLHANTDHPELQLPEPPVNNFSQALKSAGVPLPPLNKRVWLWLHDHPDKTSTEVANALNVQMSNVSSVLGDMTKRRMCSVRRDSSGHTRANVLRYTTKGKSYVLLPKPRVILAAKTVEPLALALPLPAPVAAAATAAAAAAQDVPETFAKLTALRVLDTLNVREALTLYRELHKMFSSAPLGDATTEQ